VIPRFSLSCDEPLLESCASLLTAVDGAWLTSHINEHPAEMSLVAELFGGSDYLETYERYGLVGVATVLAHNLHPTDDELKRLADADAAIAHCPTSNCSLGGGLFPLRRHLAAGVRVALGSDVGAGTGFCLLKEGLQAYFVQQLLGEQGVPLSAAQLLHLSTSAGAHALGLAAEIGDLSVGKRFDAVWLRPAPGTTLDVVLQNAVDPDEALAKAFTLGNPSDVAGVWVDGRQVQR
jgi:guanine deaminase